MFRTLPPAGVPIPVSDILASLMSVLKGDNCIEKFKEAICSYFRVKHCFFASSGRASLAMLLTAMKNLKNDKNEVVLPAYTSFSVPSAVVKAKLKVSLCDIDPETMSPDIDSLKEAITESTLCIVICHLFGYPCDIDAILKVAKEKGIYVIDDSAQAMGAKYKGRYTGTFGDAGIFSLGRGKNITTVDGGIIVTNSDEIAKEVSKIASEKTGYIDKMIIILKALVLSVLLKPHFYWIPQNLPFLNIGASIFSPDLQIEEFTEIQAGIGLRMLKRLESINKSRMEIANKLMKVLDTDTGIIFPQKINGAEPVFLRLPVISTGSSQPVQRFGIVKSYPYPLNEIEKLNPHINGNIRRFPKAERFAKDVLTLPTHEYVTGKDINKIIKHFNA